MILIIIKKMILIIIMWVLSYAFDFQTDFIGEEYR